MIEGITEHPLTWPQGWKRTKYSSASAFSRKSLAQSVDGMLHQIELLGGSHITISTNIKVRLDGLPYSNQPQPQDPGVAVYFQLNKKPVVLACDKWNRPDENIWAIAKHIEAIRGQSRWGVGTIEQAFQGYTALPMPKNYFEGGNNIITRYRELAKEMHPDKGGDPEKFKELNRQYQVAKRS